MLSYTVYSEAGGVAKSTLSFNLAVAHRRAGLDVLVVPLDPQDGDLSYLANVDADRADDEADYLARHLVNRGKGDFRDLIRTNEDGIDIVPEHNRLEDLGSFLEREADQRADFGESFPKHTQLLRVLREADIADDYDVLIVDPPATAGPHLYNAISATQNLVLPVEPSGKGQASIRGLEALVDGLSEELDIDVGVFAAVPNRVKGTTDQEAIIEEIEAMGFDVPVVIGDRTALFEGCWRKRCSAFRYVQVHRDRRRDYELETLAKLDKLARHIEREAGVEAPNPPEPGSLDDSKDVEVAQ